MQEDLAAKYRYPRRSIQSARRRRYTREDSPLINKLARQLILCAIILVTIGIIKSINTPFTKYLQNKIMYGLTVDVDIKNLYNSIQSGINKLKGEKNPVKADDSQENYGLTDATGNTSENGGAAKSKPAFILPVDGIVSSPYGERVHPLKETLEFHKGVDIEAASGTSIKAALDGEVLEVSSESGYGKYIKIGHSNGYSTVYAHCSAITVSKGQKVKTGDVVGRVGNTGISTGSHLHFEIWKDNKTLDPAGFLNISLKPIDNTLL